MKRTVYNILILIISAITYQTVEAQPAECVVRNSFPANKMTEMVIINKFGDVTLINTNVDSVIVCATASVEHSDIELAAKSLELIKLDVKFTDNTVSCITGFDEKLFTPLFSKGRKAFNVNYIIKTPEYVNVTIDNSFGDVQIENLSGWVDLAVAHGSIDVVRLTRGNEKPVNRMVLKHSEASVGNANWMSIELYHSPGVEIGSVQALSLESEFSQVTIGSVNSLVINSNSDKYKVGSLARGVVETKLSTVEISSLTDIIRSDAVLSTIRIGKLTEGFSEVNLTGISTVFTVGIPPVTPYRLSAISRGGATIIVPSDDKERLTKESSVPGVFIISGSGGGGKETKSAINADLKSGKLEILKTQK